MTEFELAHAIEDRYPGSKWVWDDRMEHGTLTVSPTHLVGVCEFLRDEPEAGYDLFSALTFAKGCLWYQLTHTTRCHRLELRVPVADCEAPSGTPMVHSLSSIWLAANWAEREVHDLHRVTFRGHPGLQPILIGDPPCLGPAHRALSSQLPHALCLSMGMRYPTSMDGLFLGLELHGERVLAVQPSFGACHVGIARAIVGHPYQRGTFAASRLDGFASSHADLAYALAVEELLQVEPPRRARQLRTVCAELQRIASHLWWLARTAQTESEPSFVGSAYALEAREGILRWLQSVGGNPITPDLVTIGGLREDIPAVLISTLFDLLDRLEIQLADLQCLLSDNPAFIARLDGIGLIDPGTALGLGLTGPCLRATGVAYDVRRAFPYCAYDELPVQVATAQNGDAGARYRVRVAEMRASLRLIRLTLSQLQSGPVNALGGSNQADQGAYPPLPAGSVFVAVESPRGELGIYLFSDGSSCPEHVFVRGPSFANLSALPLVAHGLSLDQLRTVLDSLDISAAEAAR